MTLTIQDLGSLGEFLGSIAVLVTLIYLAFQTRQNTLAIGAQLDAARITSVMSLLLSAVTSPELQEALNEDRVDAPPINEARREGYRFALLLNFQWQFQQGRRGLLPTFSEAGIATGLRSMFTRFRSFEGYWEAAKAMLEPDFVEWVEEQRPKAA